MNPIDIHHDAQGEEEFGKVVFLLKDLSNVNHASLIGINKIWMA